MVLLRSSCLKKGLPNLISLSLQSSVTLSLLCLVMLVESRQPMVDSIAWQFFNLHIEAYHYKFDTQLRDFINSVLVIIINVDIISFHTWSMYLNYGDLEMLFLKMFFSYMFIDRFPTKFPTKYDQLLNALSKIIVISSSFTLPQGC